MNRYAAASKAQKGAILDELCALTGWTRRHARRALTHGHIEVRRVPKRPVIYDDHVVVPLRKIWAVLGGPCGKRLAPFMAEIVAALERHDELDIDDDTRAKLLAISPATIDRLLAPERRRLEVRGRVGTKPGTLLRSQIPVRTFADWDDAAPGFCEVDLVAHDGGSARGDFCHTLTLTDVATGWTETRAVKNKAQVWVHQALEDIVRDLPVPLRGLDSDNGTEFINDHLIRWCAQQQITFTRSRPYRKNDNCFVEQKNWTVVRQAVGYARFEGDEAVNALNDLYVRLGVWVNLFCPQQKLVSKQRDGAKVTRRYDAAKTPLQRLQTSGRLRTSAGTELEQQYLEVNPAALQRELGELQSKVQQLAVPIPSGVTYDPRAKLRAWTFSQTQRNLVSRTSSVRQRSGPTRTS